MLGNLMQAEGTVVTAHGPVHVKWVKQGDGLTFSIDIPMETVAQIILPNYKSGKKLLVNNSEVPFRIDKNNLIFSIKSDLTDAIYK